MISYRRLYFIVMYSLKQHSGNKTWPQSCFQVVNVSGRLLVVLVPSIALDWFSSLLVFTSMCVRLAQSVCGNHTSLRCWVKMYYELEIVKID